MKKRSYRPTLEQLECRALPSVYIQGLSVITDLHHKVEVEGEVVDGNNTPVACATVTASGVLTVLRDPTSTYDFTQVPQQFASDASGQFDVMLWADNGTGMANFQAKSPNGDLSYNYSALVQGPWLTTSSLIATASLDSSNTWTVTANYLGKWNMREQHTTHTWYWMQDQSETHQGFTTVDNVGNEGLTTTYTIPPVNAGPAPLPSSVGIVLIDSWSGHEVVTGLITSVRTLKLYITDLLVVSLANHQVQVSGNVINSDGNGLPLEVVTMGGVLEGANGSSPTLTTDITGHFSGIETATGPGQATFIPYNSYGTTVTANATYFAYVTGPTLNYSLTAVATLNQATGAWTTVIKYIGSWDTFEGGTTHTGVLTSFMGNNTQTVQMSVGQTTASDAGTFTVTENPAGLFGPDDGTGPIMIMPGQSPVGQIVTFVVTDSWGIQHILTTTVTGG